MRTFSMVITAATSEHCPLKGTDTPSLTLRHVRTLRF